MPLTQKNQLAESSQEIECPLCQSRDTSYYAVYEAYDQLLYICNKCGLFFVHPHRSFVPNATDDAGNPREVELRGNKAAQAAYDQWRHVENDRIGNIIRDFARSGKTLEIGFGEGPLTEVLLTRVSEYWGIEPVPLSYKRTAERLALDPAKIFCMRAEDLRTSPIFSKKTGYFDCIVMVSVLEHISNPFNVLAFCNELLAPGGCMIISVPDSTLFPAFYRLRRLFKMEPWSHDHISFFSESNLEATFKRFNFEILQKSKNPLITELSIRYFRLYTRSLAVAWGMRVAKALKLDRLLRIQTLLYLLKKADL